MQSGIDWVGRDLQRLAREAKLLRKPTEVEWERIWRAATDWADAYGVVNKNISIDEFVRKYAPGVLREPDAPGTKPPAPPLAAKPAEGEGPTGQDSQESSPASAKTAERERARRFPRLTGSKSAGKKAS